MRKKLIKTHKERLIVKSHLIKRGQKLLQHDWRFQEIQTAVFHPDLSKSLQSVWDFWSNMARVEIPEFSALRQLPSYIHEFETIAQNVSHALEKGGLIIMTNPFVSANVEKTKLSMKVAWLDNQLTFVVKQPIESAKNAKSIFFENIDSLSQAISDGVSDRRAEVFNFA